MKKINLAFAGFRHGHIYSLYGAAKACREVTVSGAWEENQEARAEAERSHEVQFCYNTYEALLKDPSVDAVAIGNYYGARGRMVIEALRAGKHVISDKPLCTSLAELSEIKKLSKEKNLQIGLMLDLRYDKNVLAAKSVMTEIGEVNNIYFGGQHPLLYGTRPGWYFEEGKHGGVINDIAVHGIDLIKFLTGLEPAEVLAARCWNKYASKEKQFQDSGQFMLRLDNNAGLIADVSYAMPDSIGFQSEFYWDFRIWGTAGMLAFSVNSDGARLYKNGEQAVRIISGITPSDDCLTNFIAAINGNNAACPATEEVLASSLYTLEIQDHSNKEGRR